MNGIGILGRILPGYMADRWFGPLNVIIPFTGLSSMMIFIWIAVRNRTGLYIFASFYGIFAAAILGLFPAALSSLTTDLRKAGVRIGMVFSIIAFACLIGPPIGGTLVQKKHGQYEYAQCFVGGVIMLGGLILVGASLAKSREMSKLMQIS